MKYIYSLFFVLFFSIHFYACTTFVLSGKHTKDGKPMLYKNRDASENQNGLVHFNDGKFPYIGLVDGNKDWNTMVWGGFNSAGFGIMNSAAFTNNIGDTSHIIDQEGVIMKLALQTCVTLKDFEELLGKLPKPMGLDANFGVIDAYGGAAFYETGNWDFTKFDANDSEHGLLIRTNFSTRSNPEKGFGFCRFSIANESLSKAAQEKKITPDFIFDNVSRNLTHAITHTDLKQNIPSTAEKEDFRFFIDYIPRNNTTSSIVIHGVQDSLRLKSMCMYTVLGFPLVSIAVPVWITSGGELPNIVKLKKDLTTPICSVALQMKDKCFPLKKDKGYNYINLSVVLNKENNGFMQLLQPIEREVLNRSYLLCQKLESVKNKDKEIKSYYQWLDTYIPQMYLSSLGYSILE
jgi:hypothetical protein